MSKPSLDIVAIGDAIIDVIARCDDEFLAGRGFEKGSMRLLTPAQASDLYQAIGPALEISGGSAANTIAGASALGLRTAFVGQVADDQLGAIFAHDMRGFGVRFDTPPLKGNTPTGVCIILVTPDGQRTMSTCPGASHELTSAALDPNLIRSAAVTFLEGYLWGPEKPRAAMLEAARIARESGRRVAFTLSESLAIGGARTGVLEMIDAARVNILFANEHEVRFLTGCSTIAASVDRLSSRVEILVVTSGAKGAMAIEKGAVMQVPAAPPSQLVDTTGAGDQFAAGFLAALLRGRSIHECLSAGAAAAAEVISHFGARPEARKETAGL